MNQRPDIDYEYLLALHQASQYLLAAEDVREAKTRLVSETKRLFSTAAVTLHTSREALPPTPLEQAQLVIPLTAKNTSFGTLFITRQRPFTTQDIELADQWGQAAANTLTLHLPYLVQYIYGLMHQLRLPASSARGYARDLQRGDQTTLSEHQRKQIQKINHCTNLVYKTANELDALIQVDRLMRGTEKLYPTPQNIDDLLRHKQKLWQPTIFGKKEQILVYELQAAVTISVDRKQFIAVLERFLNYASLTSPEQSAITVQTTMKGQEVYVKITDQNTNVNPQELNEIFTLKHHAFQAPPWKQSGFGVGFVLSREAMAEMNGRVGVEAIVGQGSTFWVSLPILDSSKE